MIDTEDKGAWVRWGVAEEGTALLKAVGRGVPLIRNPDRREDKYAIDAALLTDIKVRRTPFLRSYKLYGIPTRRCVTLNVADVERYPKHTLLLFDVLYESISVAGQWLAFCSDLVARDPAIHTYNRRVGDEVNKASSYVLDLEWMKRCD